MIYVRQPTDEERRELERMTRQAVGRVSERARMILLSAQRRSVPEIAALFDVTEVTVRFWMRRFGAEGPSGLYDRPRSGRPTKLNAEQRDDLWHLVWYGPEAAGYLATIWTIAMLVTALVDRWQRALSWSTVRRAVHALDLRWGRPRLTMPAKVDPQKAAKQWAIAKAVVDAPPETVILYADESRIQLLPLLRAMWHWIGEQVRVPTPGTNTSRTIFGALNIATGEWTYLLRERTKKEDFIAFLEHLTVVYPAVPLILIVDNFSSHTAHAVREWLQDHPRLQLYYLPKYCSHLNPVEGIWLRLKNTVAANRLYGSMAVLLESVDAFFAQMTSQQALIWTAV